jgi:hypothetical protein
MAKCELDLALQGIQGKLGNLVYRRTSAGMVLARRPRFTATPTAAQTAVRELFRSAAAFGRLVRDNPALRARYDAAARAKGTRFYPFAVADYLNPPEVVAIDASGYHGVLGQSFTVQAYDDFEVVSVSVWVGSVGGDTYVEGPANLVDGGWKFTPASTVDVGEVVVIKATATDRAGRTGMRSVNHTIA